MKCLSAIFDYISYKNGKRIWSNGDIYEGEWLNGKRHGYGKMLYSDGTVYIGYWQNDKRQGYGSYQWPNHGSKYTGEWFNGQIHGNASITSGSLKIIATGEFSNGSLDKLKSVTICDNQGNKHYFEYQTAQHKDAKLIYTSSHNPKIYEVDLQKNNRILQVLQQFANAKLHTKSNNLDIISCRKPKDFRNILQTLSRQAKENNSLIIKKIKISEHAFVMSFEKDRCCCFDNGVLESNDYMQYFQQLAENTKYFQLESVDPLTFTTTDGNEIEIAIDSQDFICRHLANIIYEKLFQLQQNSEQKPIDSFVTYITQNRGLVRKNSR